VRIPKEIVDQIYQSTDIVEVISDYATLKKKGRNYWALSPFTKEKTPSFSVSPEKNIYKCFSSGKGGNAINFLMEIEGYNYVEALKHLAKKYGIAIPEREETLEEKAVRTKKESLYIVNKFASDYYHSQLLTTKEGRSIGFSYFKERGILEQTIKDFQLGYAPDAWESFSVAALTKQYKAEFLMELGLANKSEKTGRLIDRFRARVMFPITNAVGKVVGFGGRILSKEKKMAKYINSSESEIYHKSHVLYGLYQAKTHIRSQNQCILTEGYMDTIVLHQAGIKNVVASSGTALTADQVRLIKRLSKQVLMIYDGDNAGIKAAMRGIDILIEEGMVAKVLVLPDGHDPDSFVRAKGAEAFRAYIKGNSLDFVDFKLKVWGDLGDLSDPQYQSMMIRSISETIVRMPDKIQQELYARKVADRANLSEKLMMRALAEAIAAKEKAAKKEQKRQIRKLQDMPVTPPPPTMIPVEVELGLVDSMPETQVKQLKAFEEFELGPQEKEVIRVLVNYSEKHITFTIEGEDGESEEVAVVEFFMDELEETPLEHPIYEELKEAIFDAYEAEERFDLNPYLNHEDQAVCNLVSELLTSKYAISDNWKKFDRLVMDLDADLRKTVEAAIYHYKYGKIKKLIRENQEALSKASSPEESDELFMMYVHLMGIRKQLVERIGIQGSIILD